MRNRYFCQRKKQLLLVYLLFFFIITGCGKQEEWLDFELNAEQQETDTLETVSDTIQLDESNQQWETEKKDTSIFIDVEGAVVFPGVYELQEGDRVYQAIRAAGGLAQNACSEQINQARILIDGEQLRIITIAEWEDTREQILEESGNTAIEKTKNTMSDSEGKINLNTADLAAFMSLAGIGEAKARAILTYRETNGDFQTIEDIMKVEGIKEGVFRKIKDYIVVD